MTVVKARFDGSVFVPQEPVDLPVGFELEIPISNGEEGAPTDALPPLAQLAEVATQFPARSELPTDLAAEHDHYLYRTPKKGR